MARYTQLGLTSALPAMMYVFAGVAPPPPPPPAPAAAVVVPVIVQGAPYRGTRYFDRAVAVLQEYYAVSRDVRRKPDRIVVAAKRMHIVTVESVRGISLATVRSDRMYLGTYERVIMRELPMHSQLVPQITTLEQSVFGEMHKRLVEAYERLLGIEV